MNLELDGILMRKLRMRTFTPVEAIVERGARNKRRKGSG